MSKLLRRSSLAGTLTLLVTLVLAATASASAFDGRGSFFTGNGTGADTVTGTEGGGGAAGDPLTALTGTLQYANDNYPGAPAAAPQSFLFDGNTTLTEGTAHTDIGNLGSGDFALGFHFKVSGGNANAGQIGLFDKQADCKGGGQWIQMYIAGNFNLYVQLVGATSAAEFSGGTVDPSGWNYVELTRVGDTLHLLLNGQEVATAPYSGPNPSNTSPLDLGGGACFGNQAGSGTPGTFNAQMLSGEMSYFYMGAGSTYSLSLPGGSNTSISDGTTGQASALNYHNNFGTTMYATAAAPSGTTLKYMSGLSTCGASSCQYPLTGNGAPLTANIAMPPNAPTGQVFGGGLYSMTDLGVPLNPDDSTGYDPSTGAATIGYSVTAALPTISCAILPSSGANSQAVKVSDSGLGIDSIPYTEIYNGTISIPAIPGPESSVTLTATRTSSSSDTIWWFIAHDVAGVNHVCS